MKDRRTFLKEVSLMSVALPLGVTEGAVIKDGADKTPQIEITGDWQVRVLPGTLKRGKTKIAVRQAQTFNVSPATLLHIRDEKYENLPLFDANAAPWARGAKLRQLTTFETTATGSLVSESLVLKSGQGDAPHYIAGKDYAIEPMWATIGRLPRGISENQPVWADYDCGWSRIDTLVVNRQGAVTLQQGMAHNATPPPPALNKDETALANLWIPARLPKMTTENLYPIIEPTYPEPKRRQPSAVTLLPKTWAKLRSGQPLHILAWGDSVTAGGQASTPAHQYQNRFVTLLKKQFPSCSLRLTTAGWGGRNSDSFLKEPPDAEFNFERAVLAPRPDLIVMEFVNDAWMTPEIVEDKYTALLKRFNDIGAEWIMLTPHFVRPDWMGKNSVRVETDPRPYVEGVRQFTARHGVALADASLRWGHLVKEGIPYVTLLSNSINHPDDRGHELFALALMELFR